jgi:hypothetical protein
MKGKGGYAASEAQVSGYGGITALLNVCGQSRINITNGIKDLLEPPFEG